VINTHFNYSNLFSRAKTSSLRYATAKKFLEKLLRCLATTTTLGSAASLMEKLE